MSDALENTAAGATRGFFGALGFILLMVGVERMTGASGIQSGVGIFLTLMGGLCFYAFFFWESAKKVLSVEAQEVIGRFAQSRITWFGMLFLVLETLILLRFLEERRWPFSYPADPAIVAENSALKSALDKSSDSLSREKGLADKWRFVSSMRQNGACTFRLQLTRKTAGGLIFWLELLRFGGWNGDAEDSGPSVTQPGITIRTTDDAGSSRCAGTLQRALSDVYPNPPSRITFNQQTDFLTLCKHDCVQIEMDY